MHSNTKILLIYTGGTIGMQKDFETGALKAFNFSKLLQRVPELKLLDCAIETISFENLLTGIGSPGRIFRLTATGLSEKLDAAEKLTHGKLAWTDTQGLRQLQQNFDDIHAVDPIVYLNTYYQS